MPKLCGPLGCESRIVQWSVCTSLFLHFPHSALPSVLGHHLNMSCTFVPELRRLPMVDLATQDESQASCNASAVTFAITPLYKAWRLECCLNRMCIFYWLYDQRLVRVLHAACLRSLLQFWSDASPTRPEIVSDAIVVHHARSILSVSIVSCQVPDLLLYFPTHHCPRAVTRSYQTLSAN